MKDAINVAVIKRKATKTIVIKRLTYRRFVKKNQCM